MGRAAGPLARWELSKIVTTSPHTNNFRHMLPVRKAYLQKADPTAARIKLAKTRDRIKWWNIVPGDQVRVLADKTNFVREVLSVNKLSNRVYLKREGKVRAGSRNAVLRLQDLLRLGR